MTITEQQMQEIAGRLNALTVQGLINMEHVISITNILGQIKQASMSENATQLPEKEASKAAANGVSQIEVT